jgi:hypothetical protein
MEKDKKQEKLKIDLGKLIDSIHKNKSTSDLYKFKDLLDIILDQEKKKILFKSDIIKAIESFNGSIPSK